MIGGFPRSRDWTGEAWKPGRPALISPAVSQLVLRACDRVFTVECASDETTALLRSVFSAFVRSPGEGLQAAVRRYTIGGPDSAGRYVVSDGASSRAADGADDLIYQIDKAITIALQLERPDLFFLHSAAIAVDGRVVALPAFPGTGKSTLTLALTAGGIEYLSDELTPVDLNTLTVTPYPHAVCLKSPPPAPYHLPRGTVTVNRRCHVPVEALSSLTRHDPLPLAAIVFPRRDTQRFSGLRRLTPASAATCLMAHLLNGLAHPNYGLDAAIALSQVVPCFELDVTDLPTAVNEIAAL